MNKDELKSFIESRSDLECLKHASNILTKIKKWEKLSTSQKTALPLIGDKYIKFLTENDKLVGYSEKIVNDRVKLLNEYYDFLDANDYYNTFSSQGKFRSTILEEFMFLLFKDLVSDKQKSLDHSVKDKLLLGSSRAYTNLYFLGKDLNSFLKTPQIGINQKDQDFAIYRPIDINIVSGKVQKTNLPIISIENKTYIDKTMLEGSVATAEKIKSGNPYSLYYIVAENYDVDLKIDPVYSRIDQIYVLRKSKRKGTLKPIDAGVVYSLVQDVEIHLGRKWSDVKNKMETTGKIL